MIYVLGYNEEKNSKVREKKAEMAAHTAARAASVAPSTGLVESERDAEEVGESINSISLELNAKFNEERGYVTDGFQLDKTQIPSLKPNLEHHNDLAFATNFVLVQNLTTSSSAMEIIDKEKEAPMITEIKDGDSHFNANSIPSSINQHLASSKEKTQAISSHVMEVQNFDSHDVHQSLQSTVGTSGQPNSLRTWKSLLRQCSPGVFETQSEPKKKRKSSFNLADGSNPPNKRIQVPHGSENFTNIMVEAAVQPYQKS